MEVHLLKLHVAADLGSVLDIGNTSLVKGTWKEFFCLKVKQFADFFSSFFLWNISTLSRSGNRHTAVWGAGWRCYATKPSWLHSLMLSDVLEFIALFEEKYPNLYQSWRCVNLCLSMCWAFWIDYQEKKCSYLRSKGHIYLYLSSSLKIRRTKRAEQSTQATSTLLRLKVKTESWIKDAPRPYARIKLCSSSSLQPNYRHIAWPLNITQHLFIQRIFPLSVT